MKLLHFSDLHIGVEGYSRPATEADLDTLPAEFAPGVDRRQTYLGLPTRLLDALRAFDELVNTAIAEQVDLVIFSGDAYRSRDPSQTHQREFARRIARLTGAGIPIFLLAGNHDLPNAFGRATAVEIFDTLSVPSVSVASKLGINRVQTRSGPIQIVAVPWMRRSSVLAQKGAQSMSFEEINQFIETFLTASIQQMAAELDPALPAILAAHVTVSTARLSSERTMMIGNDYALLPSVLSDPRFDYVALGHIHKHQVLGNNPPVVYAGSVHRVDFSEEDDAKGFCLVELDTARPAPIAPPIVSGRVGTSGQRLVGWQFHEVWSRRFTTIRMTIPENDADPTASVLARIAHEKIADAIVRVDVKLPAAQAGRLDIAEVRRALAPAHAIAGVSAAIEREDRTRLSRGMAVEHLTPLDALELYLDNRKTGLERRTILIQYAKGLLAPEDISTGREQKIQSVVVRLAGADDMEGAYAVRRAVFVEEQGVPAELEWDGQDVGAVHAVALVDGKVIATGRLLLNAASARIGRMAVLAESRREGIGGRILEALEKAARERGASEIVLHAQSYAKEFYAGHGYREERSAFIEAGIQHVAMRKKLDSQGM